MQEETVCINGRFCWKKKLFSAWGDLFTENDDFILLPYRNEIADFLISDGEHYLEMHIGSGVFDKFRNSDAVYRKKHNIYLVSSASSQQTKFATVDEALCCLYGKKFTPEYIYHAGHGQLEELLNDPDSVLMILPFWRPYELKNGVYQIRSEETNKDGVNRWNRMFYDRKLTRELRKKRVLELIKFRQYSILLRCGGSSNEFSSGNNPCCSYSLADYRGDGICYVLSSQTQTGKDINDFIKYYSELAWRYGLDSFFLKKREQSKAVFREQEEIIWRDANALQRLFSYLHDLYNGGYRPSGSKNFPELTIPYIAEEIERSEIKYCGSFCGAMAFYQTRTPVRRSMWHPINAPAK